MGVAGLLWLLGPAVGAKPLLRQLQVKLRVSFLVPAEAWS